jgi:type IV pilus assembly protein PilZ
MNHRGVGDSERPAADAGAVTGRAGAATGTGLAERRSLERVDVLWSVDCETEDTFLYAAITNISEMGIFVRTVEPLAVGTVVTLRFAPSLHRGAGPAGPEAFVLEGVVQWVNPVRPQRDNPNPGMGVRFTSLTLADRERIVEAIHTIAYLREEPRPKGPAADGN